MFAQSFLSKNLRGKPRLPFGVLDIVPLFDLDYGKVNNSFYLAHLVSLFCAIRFCMMLGPSVVPKPCKISLKRG